MKFTKLAEGSFHKFAQFNESSLCAQWVAKDPKFLHADREDSDQTGRMPRLIRVFAGRTGHFVCFVVLRLISITLDVDAIFSIDADRKNILSRGQHAKF